MATHERGSGTGDAGPAKHFSQQNGVSFNQLQASAQYRNEQQEHRAVVQHLQARAARGTYWFHPANGGARSKSEGAIFKGLGVRAGTPDLILIRGGRTYGLELKSSTGRLSPAQIAAHEEMRAAGAEVAVAIGLDQAIAQLENWQLLRGRVS
jgi:hypothetical protein